MSPRPAAAIGGLLALAIASSWSASRWRQSPRERPQRPELRAFAREGVPEALRVLGASPAYRGILSPAVVLGARVVSSEVVELEIDPREAARGRAETRAHPSLLGLLPTVARGRIELHGDRSVTEAWRLACPEGCGLDVLDRDPPAGSPSAAWSARPRACRAIAWFALDARRLDDPTLGGEGLAPLRERVVAIERLLGRSIRAELAAGLAGTGIVALEERDSPRGPRLLVALDLARPDRVRPLVDLVVSLAVVAGRGEVLHHREVALGIVGTRARGAAVAIDGPLLLLSDEPGAVIAAIDRRRGPDAPSATPPAPFDRFRGSWRAESTAGPVSATLVREGPWWWLRGEGASPALTADPVLPALRAWLAGASGRRDATR